MNVQDSRKFQKFIKNQKRQKAKFRLLQFVEPCPVSICAKFQKISSINKGGVRDLVKHECTG